MPTLVSDQNWSGNSCTSFAVAGRTCRCRAGRRSRGTARRPGRRRARRPARPRRRRRPGRAPPIATARQNQPAPRLATPAAARTSAASSATSPSSSSTVRTSAMWPRSRSSSTGAPLTATSNVGGPKTRSDRMLPVTCVDLGRRVAGQAGTSLRLLLEADPDGIEEQQHGQRRRRRRAWRPRRGRRRALKGRQVHSSIVPLRSGRRPGGAVRARRQSRGNESARPPRGG